jgi:hypothetical protein
MRDKPTIPMKPRFAGSLHGPPAEPFAGEMFAETFDLRVAALSSTWTQQELHDPLVRVEGGVEGLVIGAPGAE